MKMKTVSMLLLTAFIGLMLSVQVPALAAGVSDTNGSSVTSTDGAPVVSADSSTEGNHTGALSVFMLAAAVLASPLTLGGSFGVMTVAWPALIGSVAAGASAVSR